VSNRIAEVLCKEPCGAVPLHACDPVLSSARKKSRVEHAIDHLELQVGIAFIQTHLEIVRRASGAAIIGSRPPLDIEYPIWRASTNRSEHSTVRAGDTETVTSAQILPRREDGEIIRHNRIGSRGEDVVLRRTTFYCVIS